MNLDFVKALKAPLSVDNWIIKILIGGILILIPFVNFIVLGYLVKALKNFINKQDKLPEYSNMGELFLTGGKLVIGCVLFMIPFVILIAITSLLFSKISIINSVITLIIEIIAGFAGTIMVAGFAMDEKILSMVDFKRMMKFIKDNNSGVVSLIIGLVGLYLIYTAVSIIACFTLVGIILLPFLSYAMMISTYNMIGQFAANAPNIEEIKAEASAQ